MWGERRTAWDAGKIPPHLRIQAGAGEEGTGGTVYGGRGERPTEPLHRYCLIQLAVAACFNGGDLRGGPPWITWGHITQFLENVPHWPADAPKLVGKEVGGTSFACVPLHIRIPYSSSNIVRGLFHSFSLSPGRKSTFDLFCCALRENTADMTHMNVVGGPALSLYPLERLLFFSFCTRSVHKESVFLRTICPFKVHLLSTYVASTKGHRDLPIRCEQ